MKTSDLIGSAVGNTFRSKSRTGLTVAAIIVGAFTLTLTTGIGAGVNNYIDGTVASIGASDVMTVTKSQAEEGDGPRLYDPSATTTMTSGGDNPGGSIVETFSATDLDELRSVAGAVSVDPVLTVTPTDIRHADNPAYQVTVGGFVAGTTMQLQAGASPQWNSERHEVAIPSSYVEPMGFAGADDAVGKTVSFGVTDATGSASRVDAVVTGVSEPGLAGGGVTSANTALTRALYDRQNVGLPIAGNDIASATLRFDPAASDTEVSALKQRLADIGYEGQTVDDQIGQFKRVIDAVVLVLNGFAAIALVAAGFGIVNTLLMSVQERTREIGLMKAMGMGGGRVFGLFSYEAVFIGFLGSAIGAGAAILGGTVIDGVLSRSVLEGLPGFSLVSFSSGSVAVILAAVMFIAFLAGTLPAYRAARQDPIESLRYE